MTKQGYITQLQSQWEVKAAEQSRKELEFMSDVPPLASKKLTIHSNSGNILLCFDGFDLPRISILNYGDISAQEVAERLLVCWNKHIHESVEAIQG